MIYWSSQALAWLVLPLGQTYLTAGDFTPWQKFKTAVRANAVAYIPIGVIAAILLVYIAIKNHLDASGLEQVGATPCTICCCWPVALLHDMHTTAIVHHDPCG